MISRWILFRMRNVSDKTCTENQNTFKCSITYFRKSCRVWDNVQKRCRAGQATDDDKIRRVRIACWITKVTNTHSECVILIALPRQQRFGKRASTLWLYVHYLSCFPSQCLLYQRSSSHCSFSSVVIALTFSSPPITTTVFLFECYSADDLGDSVYDWEYAVRVGET